MAARYQVSLADSSDDAELRRRMASDPMQGDMALSFRREPDYFLGCGVQGDQSQIIKCVDSKSGRIVGLGARHSKRLFVNGVETRFGYLSDLRGDKNVRKRTLLARGYAFLRELHSIDEIRLYFSVILDGNDEAISALTTARAGLPIYEDRGRILTPAIYLDRQKPELLSGGVTIRRGEVSDMPQVFEFLQREHAKKQLAPCYRHSDLGSPRLLGLTPENFYIAYRGGRVAGCVAIWDQSEFRQTHVERYSGSLRMAKPFFNFAARFSSLHALPAAGEKIPYLYLSLIATENNRADIFATLLRTVYREQRNREYHFLIAGLHEQDPLCEVLNEYRSIEAGGRLFLIYYPEDAEFAANLDDRTYYVEMGTV
jgi:hypothetical protein